MNSIYIGMIRVFHCSSVLSGDCENGLTAKTTLTKHRTPDTDIESYQAICDDDRQQDLAISTKGKRKLSQYINRNKEKHINVLSQTSQTRVRGGGRAKQTIN
jgi:hypothetical protein